MNGITAGAFFDELEKLSARAGLRLIRNLVSQGTPEAMGQASHLATSPGVLKPGSGSFVRHLGAGNEGVADLVAHPQHGVAVRKLYNPASSLANPNMISRKMQMAKQIDSPLMAETKGFHRSQSGGRMTFHEFVPGSEGSLSESKHIRDSLRAAGGQKGYDLQDIRPANIRGGKAIDVMPFHQGEVDAGLINSSGVANGAMGLTPSGLKAVGVNPNTMAGRTSALSGETAGATPLRNQLYKTLQGAGTERSLQGVPQAPTRAAFTPSKDLSVKPTMRKPMSGVATRPNRPVKPDLADATGTRPLAAQG